MLLHSANQRVFLREGVLIKKEMFIKIKNFSFLDKSLYYIFQNYNRNITLNSYSGINFCNITGYEQAVTNGIPVFYVVDASHASTARVVVFNQNWLYQAHYILPKVFTFAMKYIQNQGFYFTADSYLQN
jgi:DNA phosphorothioation-dependent restriction protein DptG